MVNVIVSYVRPYENHKIPELPVNGSMTGHTFARLKRLTQEDLVDLLLMINANLAEANPTFTWLGSAAYLSVTKLDG